MACNNASPHCRISFDCMKVATDRGNGKIRVDICDDRELEYPTISGDRVRSIQECAIKFRPNCTGMPASGD